MKTAQLNSVIHAPNRFQVCAMLSPLEYAEFRVLRDALDVSDSVLSKHIKQLEEAGYVTQSKASKNGRNCTRVRLTKKGRQAFKSYVSTLQQIIALAEV